MMRVNKVAKEYTITKLEEFVDRLKIHLDECMSDMRAAKTAEEMMESKKELLLALADIPRGPFVCYFCNIYFAKCSVPFGSKCPYGKIHGNCQKEESDYGKISDARNVLEVRLKDYHQSHQKYVQVK